jgi:hypothetical protein
MVLVQPGRKMGHKVMGRPSFLGKQGFLQAWGGKTMVQAARAVWFDELVSLQT